MRFAFLPFTIMALSSADLVHASEPERITARVSLDGLDLVSGRHQAEIDRRVRIAARRACIERTVGAPRITAGQRACIAEMIADGRVQTMRLAARAQTAPTVGRR
jgi:UrcA family protein